MKTSEAKFNTALALLKSDIESQDTYVRELEERGDAAYSLIAASTFVQGMRDSGYKSTATAIDEFIDNSLQSDATEVIVISTSIAEKGGALVSGIAVVDNGHGMRPAMVRAAVMWGGTHRFNDRAGFGRYGFGLPSAAVSITDHYEVYSKIEGGTWQKVSIRLQDIAAGKLTNETGLILAPHAGPAELPKFVQERLGKHDLKSGTVVVLMSPDRLTSGYRKANTFETNLLEHLGLVYRGSLRTCKMSVNGKAVEPVDPLFQDPTARFYDGGNRLFADALAPLQFQFKNRRDEVGTARLRFSYMPPGFQTAADGGKHKGRFGVMKANNAYLIVTRAGRQIDLVTRPNYNGDSHNITLVNYDRNWAIELDFDPTLDEEFGITVNKQQVTLSDAMWQRLAEEKIPEIIKAFRKRFKEQTADLESAREVADKPRESEQIMQEAEKFSAKKPRKATGKKLVEAKEKLENEAAQKAKDLERPQEEVLGKLAEKYAEHPYVVEFESLEGAPFYRVEQHGPQIRLWINRRHRFYTDVYAGADSTPRMKTSLELLLFALGVCELSAQDDREIFYKGERQDWSRELETLLNLQDRRHSVEDAKSAATEDSETRESPVPVA